jgi:hypothetical protein
MLPSPRKAWVRTLLAGFVVAAVTGIAPAARAQEPDDDPAKEPAAPEQDLPPPSTRLNLALTGGIITGAWYGAALGSSFALKDHPWSDELRIPLAGPFLALSQMECRIDESNCTRVIMIVRTVLAALDGIGQVGGVGVLLESLFVPTASSDAAWDKPRPEKRDTKRVSFRARPIVGEKGMLGIGVSGEL